MHNIAIIHGYGRVVPNNTFYDLYIDKLAHFLDKNNIDTIICSGGFTDSKVKQSEAESLKIALESKLSFDGQWLLEEKSFTTFANIKEIEKLIQKDSFDSIHVFCRNTHLPKIIYQSLQSYLGQTKHETLSCMQTRLNSIDSALQHRGDIVVQIDKIQFVGLDLNANEEQYGKALRSSIIESHYDEFPELHEEFVTWRKKIWNISD